NALRLAGWHHVSLDDEIAAGFQPPRRDVKQVRRLPRRPAEKVAVREHGVAAAAAVEAWPRIVVVEPTGRSCAIDLDVRVMDRPGHARMDLETPDVSTRRQLDRDDEGAKHIRAVTSEQVRLRHRDHQIRVPELPAAGPSRRRRKIVGIALRSPELDPLLNELDLSIAQSPLAGKLSISRFGFPG